MVSFYGSLDGNCVVLYRTHLVYNHYRYSVRQTELQARKACFLALRYAGKKDFGKHPIANIIWIIFGGLFLAIGFGVLGLIWCITIIGIPFGKQCFKLAGLALTPFGAEILSAGEVKAMNSEQNIAA